MDMMCSISAASSATRIPCPLDICAGSILGEVSEWILKVQSLADRFTLMFGLNHCCSDYDAEASHNWGLRLSTQGLCFFMIMSSSPLIQFADRLLI